MNYISVLDETGKGTIPKPSVLKPVTIVDSDGNLRIIYVSCDKRNAN